MMIAKADIHDLPAILSLQKLAFQSQAELVNDFSIPPMTQTLESITEDFHAGTMLKATREDNPAEIIGSVRGYVRGNTLYIGRLIVDPSYQNRGIGTKLLLAIEAMHPDCRYELFTGIKSEKNLSFYVQNGYRECKREAFSERVTLVFMEKQST